RRGGRRGDGKIGIGRLVFDRLFRACRTEKFLRRLGQTDIDAENRDPPAGERGGQVLIHPRRISRSSFPARSYSDSSCASSFSAPAARPACPMTSSSRQISRTRVAPTFPELLFSACAAAASEGESRSATALRIASMRVAASSR